MINILDVSWLVTRFVLILPLLNRDGIAADLPILLDLLVAAHGSLVAAHELLSGRAFLPGLHFDRSHPIGIRSRPLYCLDGCVDGCGRHMCILDRFGRRSHFILIEYPLINACRHVFRKGTLRHAVRHAVRHVETGLD